MKIASINPESTIDYPGKYGPVVFTAGCNFNCGFCHNPELASGKANLIDDEKLEIFLKNLKIKVRTGWYSGICISGGEPTIQEDLPEFIRKIKQEGLFVKLDTNGGKIEILEQLLKENLVDYVAMDIKGPKELYPILTKNNSFYTPINVARNMALLSSSKVDYEFRTTVVPFFKNGNGASWISPGVYGEMAKWIVNSTEKNNHKHYLQKFVARGKEEMMDERYAKENLAQEFQETPIKILENIRDSIRRYIPNCEIR